MVSSLRTELQKIPTKNHNKNPHTTKKSAVTKVLRAFRMVVLTLASSLFLAPSCSCIRLASSKSCCKESSIEEEEEEDVNGEEEEDTCDGVLVVVVAVDVDCELKNGNEKREESSDGALPPTICRISIISIWTGVSSRGCSSIKGWGAGGGGVDGEDVASILRRRFRLVAGETSLSLLMLLSSSLLFIRDRRVG